MTLPSLPIPAPSSRHSADEIRAIQNALIASGFPVGASGADGKLGPATRKAYSDYAQARLPKVTLAQTEEVGRSAAAFARTWIGPREEAGNNRGFLPDLLARHAGKEPDAAFWCARFCWFCWDMAARSHGFVLAAGQTSGSVARSWERSVVRYEGERLLVAPVGAMVAVKTKEGHHIELVNTPASDLWLSTVGGNTSSGRPDRNGGGVWDHPSFKKFDDPSVIGAFLPVLVPSFVSP